MKLTGNKATTIQTGDFISKAIEQHADARKKVATLVAAQSKKTAAEVDQLASADGGNAPSSRPTDMQLDFWAACYLVPKGHVATYGTLSRIVQGVRGESYAVPRYARHAGKCMSTNPVAPVVPCHRVVGASGALTGFQGKTTSKCMKMKADLLRQEGVPVVKSASTEQLSVPAKSGKLL